MEDGVAFGEDELQKLLVSNIAEMNMNNGSRAAQPRSIGHSILALFAGFVAVVVLSVATDLGLHVGAYIVARLAPFRTREHALIGGDIRTVVSITGAAATGNRVLGPHRYPVA